MRERSHRGGAHTAIRVEANELHLDHDLSPDLAAALDYWRQKKAARLAPARRDIDPLDIAGLLPRVMLVDVLRAGDNGGRQEFRYRLAGTGIVKNHGMELTNRGPRDLQPAAYGALVHDHYTEALSRRAPLAHRLSLQHAGSNGDYRRIILPLSDDGGSINRLMTVDSYEDGGQGLRDCFKELVAGI